MNRRAAWLSGALLLAMGWGMIAFTPTPARAAPDEVFTAIYSMAYNGYQRVHRSDGTLKPETYVFGEGKFGSGDVRDSSIDGLPFATVARTVATYLARENYLPTPAPDKTDLLIVVHWGTTIPFDDGTYRNAMDRVSMAMSTASSSNQLFGSSAVGKEGAGGPTGTTGDALNAQMNGELTSALMMMNMENRARDLADERNAALLGYLPDLSRLREIRDFAGLGTHYNDLVSEVEEDRYYVILAAFDFRTAWKEKKRKLLWVTRVSIRARGNRFDKQLAAMLAGAAPYFGRTTPALVRGFVPDGKVEIGAPKVIEFLPASAK